MNDDGPGTASVNHALGDPNESRYGPLGDPDDDGWFPHPSKLDFTKPVPPDFQPRDITADYLKGAIQITGGVRPPASDK